jgi:photosystem II stability/assembly factor-like uncharacterized protein
MIARTLTCIACLILATVPLLAARPTPGGPATPDDHAAAWERHRQLERESLFRELPWRCVGPIVQGGRIVDIEVVPGEPYHFYIAYASGGLWHTTNNGVTFEPLFEDQQTMVIGDVALDPQNPKTIWIGTGENNSSRSSYGGAGVFRSDDGGATWRAMGLAGTDRIGRVLVDPRDSKRVLVAALGKLYTPGGDRGIYLTTDGGESWRQVQAGENEWTGFIDMVRDPRSPDVLYAASWERSRRPWNFVEGGPGSGIWKSADNGDSWTRVNGRFPRGDYVGRIGLAVAPSRPGTLYAVIDNQRQLPEDQWDLGGGAVTAKRLRTMTKEEFLLQDPDEIESFIRGADLDPELTAEKLIEKVKQDEITLQDLLDALQDANRSLFETDIVGPHVWRSDDGGASWKPTHSDPIRQMVYTYGYYFGQIRVAPDDADRVYILGVPLLTSADGGKTWGNINERNVHVDHHDLWVDPAHPERLLLGNDGGLNMSFDGGASWLTLNAVPVGQFYTVAVDMADPYNIYGGLQDNGVLKGSSRAKWRADTQPAMTREWQRIGGGDGMYIQVDPRDNKTVYWGYQFGFYTRNDASGKRERVRPRNKLKEEALRYNWSTPILLSEHNPDILYFGANKLFRSMDKGKTWSAISPDLTRSAERGDVPFATLTSIDESSQRFGLLWAGTDDGHVHVTRDGGVTWSDVSDGLPRDRWVSRVEASSFEENAAFVSLNGYRDDDITAYVYRTSDLGKTWVDISDGLPDEPVNVIRQDPVNGEVLYVGTDRGVYVSLDGGKAWQALQGGLPKVPVHDLVVHPRERELVAGTHGRSVWVVDVLPLQEMDRYSMDEAVDVFSLEDIRYERGWKQRRSPWWFRPDDAPYVDITFWAKEDGRVTVSVWDELGENVLFKDSVDAVRGVNVYRWDLLLDERLALAAEAAAVATDRESKKDKAKKSKKKTDEEAAAAPVSRKETPWAEAVRLERPLYITPGTYSVNVTVGATEEHHETELVIKKPEPREPRVEPKPKIRGEKDDKKK